MFDVLCYVVAIVAVLWFVGEPREAAPIALPPVTDDLPTVEELLAEALIAKPLPPRTAALVAQAAAVAAPVAVAVVKLEAPAYADMTSAQLRKECSKATPQIAWRNAHGKGKHLRKEEMVKALA